VEESQETRKRLVFVVRFVAADIDRLSDVELVTLRRELAWFIGEDAVYKALYAPGPARMLPNMRRLLESLRSPARLHGIVLDLPDGRTALELSREDLHRLQGAASALLNGWADFNDAVSDKSGKSVPKDVTEFGLTNARFLLLPGCIVVTTKDVEGAFALKLAMVLASPGASRVRRCPECRSFYVRVRRQEYCGRRCVNRANMRAWRKTERARKRTRDRDAGGATRENLKRQNSNER